MNKWIKRTLYFALFCGGFNTLERFCHQQTDGFSIARIQFDPQTAEQKTSSPIPDALAQPFYYLDCGNQCFAFISDDQTLVLKFFKYAHHTPPVWATKLPLLNRFKSLRPHKLVKRDQKRSRDFQSYQLAFTHFKEEAALLAIHLEPTSNHYPTIELYDKLQIRHQIDLNKTPFILQKKATPVYTQFQQWLKAGHVDKVEEGVSRLIELCARRLSKKIHDDDVHFYSNFGFVGETPIQVDPGHFVLHDSLSKADELQALSVELKEWFSQHYPPLVSHVEACIASH